MMDPKDMKEGIESVLSLIESIPDNEIAAETLFALLLDEAGPIGPGDGIPDRVEFVRTILRALETPRFVPLTILVIKKFLVKLEAL